MSSFTINKVFLNSDLYPLHTLTLDWLERQSTCRILHSGRWIVEQSEQCQAAYKGATEEQLQKILLLLEPASLLQEHVWC